VQGALTDTPHRHQGGDLDRAKRIARVLGMVTGFSATPANTPAPQARRRPATIRWKWS
jgi:hypothetical protein